MRRKLEQPCCKKWEKNPYQDTGSGNRPASEGSELYQFDPK